MVEANAAIRLVIDLVNEDAVVQKVQPPDGLVLALPDGSVWAVMAHRLNTVDGVDGS